MEYTKDETYYLHQTPNDLAKELIKKVGNGKVFKVPKEKTAEDLEPLNQKLFESLRNKHKI